MNQHRELAIKALERFRGDDAARMRKQFAGASKAFMDRPYYEGEGSSGLTNAQTLAIYEAREVEINAAIAWLRSL